MRGMLIVVWLGAFLSLNEAANARESDADSTLLAVFLKHDQTKKLDEIQDSLTRNRFYEVFPPKGIAVAEWHVVMGIGQIAVLQMPRSRLNEVESMLKQSTRDAFSFETFLVQNKYPMVVGKLKNKAKKSLDREPTPSGSLLLTIVLKPNPARSKIEVSKLAIEQRLYENFPPPGVIGC